MELLGELQNVIASTTERQDCYAAGQATSSRIAAALPLVRRLKAGGVTSPWQASVQSRALAPKSPCTILEERAEIDASVYFFLGCAAYPKGDVAIVLHSRTAQSVASSFWPFDTGSLGSCVSCGAFFGSYPICTLRSDRLPGFPRLSRTHES